MKKKLLVTIVAVALLTGCGKTVPKLADGTEAFVTFGDGTNISVDEVWKELKLNYGLKETLNKIDKKILEEEYADKVADAKQSAETARQNFEANYPDEKTRTQVLEYYGYSSLDQYYEDNYISYLTDLAVKKHASSLVKEKEMKDYYKNESVGDIDCNHILVKPASEKTEDVNKAKEEAEKIIEAIKKDVKSGTKVADAFAKYKDNSSVTYQELGRFNKGDMVEAFEKAAYTLKKGSYSTTPVKTSYGYHIIYKVNEFEKESYDKLKDSIKETIAENKVKEDSTISVQAMIDLRKEYGIKWQDSELEDTYNKYMNYLLNQK